VRVTKAVAEYKKFVDVGGYRKLEFWKETFVRDGRTVPWEEAVGLFRDATGRPGPAAWEVGDYPKGHEKYPVAGVSWYEAAAYADFAGKSLPTAYHWTRASQARGFTPVIVLGSNFRREATQPVGSEGTFGTRLPGRLSRAETGKHLSEFALTGAMKCLIYRVSYIWA
jgi:formylglycine-generating enzyme required for sulfatase activity